MLFEGRDFEKCLGHEGEALMNEISVLIRHLAAFRTVSTKFLLFVSFPISDDIIPYHIASGKFYYLWENEWKKANDVLVLLQK